MVQKIVFLYMWSSEIQSSLVKGKLAIRFYFEIIFKEFEIRLKNYDMSLQISKQSHFSVPFLKKNCILLEHVC